MNWSYTPSDTQTFNSATTITANFSRTINNYTVTIARNNASYGTVSSNSVSIPYGTTYSVSGNVLTFSNGTKVTASVSNATGYTTTFSSWSPSSGTITGNTTITANFSRSINNYYIDLNWNVNGTGYGGGDSYGTGRLKACLKIGGTDQGCIADYYTQHPYGTSWQIYKLQLDGTDVSYNSTGTLGAGNIELKPYIYTIDISPNNSSYCSVSNSQILIPKGYQYTLSNNT